MNVVATLSTDHIHCEVSVESLQVARVKWTTLSTDRPSILEGALADVECVIDEILPRHADASLIGQVRTILLYADGHIGRPPIVTSTTRKPDQPG